MQTTPAAAPIDWDQELDQAFNLGRFDRLVLGAGWQILTGMVVRLPEAVEKLETQTGRLLIFADTIIAGGNQQPGRTVFSDFEEVVLLGRELQASSTPYYFMSPFSGGTRATFRLAVYGARSSSPTGAAEWRGLFPPFLMPSLGSGTLPYRWVFTFNIEQGEQQPLLATDLPLAECRGFLARVLLAAQAQFDKGERAQGEELLARLEGLLALFPAAAAWAEVTLGSVRTREATLLARPEADHVPYLSPGVYGAGAAAYAPALQHYGGAFLTLTGQERTLEAFRRAAALLRQEKQHLVEFQDLVRAQLNDNLRAAVENMGKAHRAVEAQIKRANAAEAAFQKGMEVWKAEQERQATQAIVFGILNVVTGLAQVMAGKTDGIENVAKAVEKMVKTTETLLKLLQVIEDLLKITKTLDKLRQLCAEIIELLAKLKDATQADPQAVARKLAEVTQLMDQSALKDAPSAGAFWDALGLELDAQLAPAIGAKIGGAAAYLKELKVVVIYGRALTTAQAAMGPLTQELARAGLQANQAQTEYEQALAELERLEQVQALTAQSLSVLWLSYRNVARLLQAALQNFDLAHRYWALSDRPVVRRPDQPLENLVQSLLDIADLPTQQQQALDGFNPPPQDYDNEAYSIGPEDARVAGFRQTQHLALRLSAGDEQLFKGLGRIGRVRVREVRVWLEWAVGQQPTEGKVVFTLRTNGYYDDQLVRQAERPAAGQASGQLHEYHFVGTPLNLSFRYDLARYSETDREKSIQTRAQVAEDFRLLYSEPTLFTEWQVQLVVLGPAGVVDPTLLSAVRGLRLEFAGTYIKDPDQLAV